MTISVVESQGGSLASGATTSPTTATTLLATDTVVVIVHKTSATGVPTVSGGGTWVNFFSQTTSKDMYVWYLTGVTGAITPTIGVGTAAGDWTLLVLRSSLSVSPKPLIANVASVSQATELTVKAAGSVWVPPGSLMVSTGSTSNASYPPLFPKAGEALPSSGWTLAYAGTGAYAKFYYQVAGGSPTEFQGAWSAAAGSFVAWMVVDLVFTDFDAVFLRALVLEAVVEYAVPATAFKGWGIPIR